MQVNVLSYLDDSAIRYPDKIAYYDSEKTITFLELKKKSQSLGTALSRKLIGATHVPIMVIVERDIESLIQMFGVVYSGNFYVTIDPKMPISRINQIISTLSPALVIGQKKHADLIASLNFFGKSTIYEDLEGTITDTELLLILNRAIIDTDPLYVLFTSGSTGVPKGVVISHRAMIDYIDQVSDLFHFGKDTIFANQASFFFDISITDLYCTLKCGCETHIVPQSFYAYPIKLIRYMNKHKVNAISWSTAAFRILGNLKAFEKEKPNYLKILLFMGEVMPCKLLNYWRHYIPDGIYGNLYGPTEITNVCTYYIVDREFADDEPLPIGFPFINTDVFLLSDENTRVPVDDVGKLGEICVRGTSLANGYYNNLKKTKDVFCQNPLNPHYPERIYHTGDLGRYNAKGEIMYVSRKDNLIKHHGYRIELGEIEAACASHEKVDAACCIYNTKSEEIILLYQAPENINTEMLAFLKGKIPHYMIPGKMVQIVEFPMTLNSKIDRVKLKEQYLNE